MYRLTMSKYHSLIIYFVGCELFVVSYCLNYRNLSPPSAINLVVDTGRDYKDGFSNVVHTTESFGIIIKSNDPVTGPPTNALWSKIDVSQPPQKTTPKFNGSQFHSKYHASQSNKISATTSKSPPMKTQTQTQPQTQAQAQAQTQTQNPGNNFEAAIVDDLMNWANRSLNYLNATTTEGSRKKSDEEEGHAFFDDDDFDDDDDDYEDDEDDEYGEEYNKKGNEDVEDIEEADSNVEAAGDETEVEPQEEYENYAETKRPIVLRTRWKSKRKHGKKHGHIKIKHFKKLKKFMLPLLLAYKLKFFTLVPLLLGGLVLIVATTGFAGFFFALFAVGLGLKTGHH